MVGNPLEGSARTKNSEPSGDAEGNNTAVEGDGDLVGGGNGKMKAALRSSGARLHAEVCGDDDDDEALPSLASASGSDPSTGTAGVWGLGEVGGAIFCVRFPEVLVSNGVALKIEIGRL